MDKCHVCKTKLNEENTWVDGLCNDCREKIVTNQYLVIICNKHDLPQALFTVSPKERKPYPAYFYLDKCNLEIEEDFEDLL